MRYDAFISYRHSEPDMYVAKKFIKNWSRSGYPVLLPENPEKRR